MCRRRWAIPILFLALASCSRRHEDDVFDAGSGGSGGNGGGGPHDAAVIKDRDLSEASFVYDGPMDDGAVDRDAACVAGAVPALPVALDMYLILDRSGTMGSDCKVGSDVDSRWCHSINALAGFFAAPTSNGLGVALGFTPYGSCTWTDSSHTDQTCCTTEADCCAGNDDLVPEVPLGELPGQLSTLTNRLNEQVPNGTTSPLEAALRGLTRYTDAQTTAHQTSGSERKVIGVIMTDGKPNGCNREIPYLAGILSAHRVSNPSIKQLTFVIGMTGADYDVLEQLAVAGGATPHTTHCAAGVESCSYYDVGNGNPEAFVDALQQIQRSIVGCRFTMPTTDAGIVDPNTLAVEYGTSTDPVATRLPHLDSPGECETIGGGWYADPEKPSEFALCPKTCSLLQGKTEVHIDVLAGCLGS